MNYVLNDTKLIKKLAVAMSENPGSTLKDIAKAADISKATIHRLYGTKDNLKALLTEKVNEILNSFIEIAGFDYFNFREGLKQLIKFHNENIELLNYAVIMHESYECEYWKRYYKELDTFFLKGQKLNIFKIDYSVQFLSELFIAGVCSVADAQRRGRISTSEIEEQFENFFLNGILA